MTFFQFSDGKKNDIQTYDFFPSFRTKKKTTYKPMTSTISARLQILSTTNCQNLNLSFN